MGQVTTLISNYVRKATLVEVFRDNQYREEGLNDIMDVHTHWYDPDTTDELYQILENEFGPLYAALFSASDGQSLIESSRYMNNLGLTNSRIGKKAVTSIEIKKDPSKKGGLAVVKPRDILIIDATRLYKLREHDNFHGHLMAVKGAFDSLTDARKGYKEFGTSGFRELVTKRWDEHAEAMKILFNYQVTTLMNKKIIREAPPESLGVLQ